MTRPVTFAPSGALAPGGLNTLQDLYLHAMEAEHIVFFGNARCANEAFLNAVMGEHGYSSPGVQDSFSGIKYIDVSDYEHPEAGRKAVLSMQSRCVVNATAPTRSFTVALKPVTVFEGGSSACTIQTGTAILTRTFTTPGASSDQEEVDSVDLSTISDGMYALVGTSSGTIATSSVVDVYARVTLHYEDA